MRLTKKEREEPGMLRCASGSCVRVGAWRSLIRNASKSSKASSSVEKDSRDGMYDVLKFGYTPAGLSEEVKQALSLRTGNRKDLLRHQMEGAVKEFRRFDGDTGSTPVQIAALTVRIEALKSHCLANKKDKHNKRGLDNLLSRRRKLMKYLARKDFDSYANVVKSLNLKGVD